MESTCDGQARNAFQKLRVRVKRAEGKKSEMQARLEQVGQDHSYMIL